MTNNRTPYELCMRRDLTPTSTSELDMLFDQYLAMGQALLDKREFSYTKGNVAEVDEVGLLFNQLDGEVMTMRDDYDHSREWHALRTPKDWREEEFVSREGDGTIPLWVTLLVACGLWGVGYYLVVLGLYLWGLI